MNRSGSNRTSLDDIRAWLIAHLAERTGVDPQAIRPTERFQRLGMSSLTATAMLAELGAVLGRPLSPTLAWEYPTPEALAQHLAKGDAGADAPDVLQKTGRSDDEPIAIVGIACRFPKAPNPEAFWALLRDGVDAITEVPADRWELDALYDPDPGAPGKLSTRWGGFLSDVDQFEPGFFGISPREAIQIDPQQRLALELSWEALEDAGISPTSLKDTRTSVFFGAMWMDYSRVKGAVPEQIVQHTATGQDLSIVPARISYTLGLLGPSVAVNTACSSSLVAVHLACQSLLRGESRIALAGGINLLLSPDSTIMMSKFGAMAPDGRSKAFDARANGYVRGEGGGVVVLKRLSDAQADGDTIYCVIRGSAINNDGFSNGLTAPSPRAQQAVLRDACAAAGVAPSDIQYVEAHGTGTMLGDPIEAGALGAALGAGAGRAPERELRIGSVKTNIGHLEAAAGMAGLIKVALSMHRRTLPPNLHFERPNPHIPFEALRLRVQTALEPWEGEQGRLLAGVSSFGFGGTNSHVIVEANFTEEPRLFVLSAESEEALRAHSRRLVEALRAPSAPSLEAVCQEAAREEHAAWRLAVMVRSRAELSQRLEAFAEGKGSQGLVAGRAEARPRVVFMFGGQGSQWHGMGRDLLQNEPAARAVLEQCDQAMRPYVAWSLLERLQGGDAALSDQTDFVQPAIFALQVALSAVFRARGVEPYAVIGQSMGEVAAAFVAGALSLDDAARIICLRSQLVARAAGKGGMAVVGLSLEAATEALSPYDGRLSIAVSSGPTTTVVAGDGAALQELLARLEAQGVFCRAIRVDYASHSPQMDFLLPDLRQALAGIAPRSGSAAFYSTVLAAPLEGAALDVEYWARNLREPVLFAPTVRRLAEEGVEVFVEVDPHPVLVPSVEQCLVHDGRRGIAVAAAQRDEAERVTLLDASGRLIVAGVPVRVGAESAGRAEQAVARLFTLSAKSKGALDAQAAQLSAHLSAHPELGLGDVAFSLATTRSPMEHRLAVAAASREELKEALDAVAEGLKPAGAVRGQAESSRGKLAFLFTGQGAQVAGMGRGLYAAWPAFREAFDRCVTLFDKELERPLREVMWAEPGSAEAGLLDHTAYTQPALFTLEYALAALWRSWGVEPDLLAGHSIGEIVAACVAGVFSLQDAARLVAARGRLMQALPPGGAMVAIATTEAEVAIAVAPHAAAVSIAAINGPEQVVISGAEEPVRALAAAFAARGVRTTSLKVSHAFHSPLMDAMLEPFRRVAESVTYSAPTLQLASNVTGTLAGSELASAEYWVRHVREAVRFTDGIKTLHAAGASTFVEVGPRATLVGVVPVCVPDGAVPTTVASLHVRREEPRSILEALGGVWAAGHLVDWAGVFPAGGRRVLLPTYAWQRQRYWLEATTAAPGPLAAARLDHPLLGAELSVAGVRAAFETALGAERLPYLSDYRIFEQAVLPASAVLELSLAAAVLHFGQGSQRIEGLMLQAPLVLPDAGALRVQVTLADKAAEGTKVSVHSQASSAPAGSPWTEHALAYVQPTSEDARPSPVQLASIQARCATDVSVAELYAALSDLGLKYGPAFQAIAGLRRGAGEAISRVELPAAASERADTYELHPVLLDAALQTLGAALGGRAEDREYLVFAVESYTVWQPGAAAAWVHARVSGSPEPNAEIVSGDISIVDDAGHVLAEVSGVRLKRIGAAAFQRAASPAAAQAAPPPRPRKRALRGWAARLGALSPAARAAEVDAAVRTDIAKVLKFPSKDDVPHDRPLNELGLDSVMAVELRNTLAERLDQPLPATLVFDYPTADALTRYVLEQARPTEPSEAAARPMSARGVDDEPIAIVGIGCRFPGGVRDIESFWRLLEDGVDAIREVPKDRWDIDAYYDPDPDVPGKMMTRSAGFLDDVDQFDPGFFGIAPREAVKMDPQQRLLLEVTWEALEHAGMLPDRLMGSETGVFVGMATSDYAQLTASSVDQLDGYVFTGYAPSVASGRISYVLGLRGPSVTMDTACSSSLVALHLACQSLRSGECSTALAGGVTLNLTPAEYVEFSRLRALSPEGRCKSFDASADGAIWSDGCGMVVLKRLSDAQRDRDTILAVIRGSAINQDGRSNGLTAPSGLAQEAVIRRALEKARVAPSAVSYVEAHGTGTPLGDPIEMLALGKALAEGRPEGSPVVVGSLKSNIGHAVAAAGIGGVIKTVLAMQHEMIPRSLHFRTPSPHIPWAELPVKVAAEPVPWKANGVARIAGVSSFGVSGTNAHVVLEEAPRAAPAEARAEPSMVLLPLSAKSPEALSALASAYRGFLSQPATDPPSSLEDIAYTASVRRSHHEHRMAVLGRSREELCESLDALLRERESAAKQAKPKSLGRPKLAFVFSGQGSQWVGMGRELIQKEPVFRAVIDTCDALVRRYAGWSLRDELEAPEATSRLNDTEVVQPALFAIQVALVELWKSLGVEPDAVIGHSVGEVAAAHVAGALSLDAAVRLVVARGRVMQQATGLGKMASVALSEENAIRAIQGYEGRVAIGAVNDPGSVVLSGEANALAEVTERLQEQGVDCRMLRVNYAFHSPQMAPFQLALSDELDGLSPDQAKLTMYSTVAEAKVEGDELDAAYWGRNIREPVRFAGAVEAAIRDGHRLFLEVGPHPVLSANLEQCLAAAKAAGSAIPTLRRGKEERRSLLQALGTLYTQGAAVAFETLYPKGGRCVALPLYPWQRQRYWVEPAPEKAARAGASASKYPLLGAHQTSARTGEQLWDVVLDPDRLPLLREHRAHGLALVPMAVIADLVLSAAGNLWSTGTAFIKKCTLRAPWIIPDEGRRSGQLVLIPQSDDRLLFELFSAPEGDGAWERHASGEVVRAPATEGAFDERQPLTEIRARCREETTRQDHEEDLRARGLSLEGSFRCLEKVWRRAGEAVARIRLPEGGPSQGADFRIHPALLEAGMRALVFAMPKTDSSALLLPDRFEHMSLHGRGGAVAWSHALLRDTPGDGTWNGDVYLLDEDGRVVMEITGLHFQRADREIARQAAGRRLNDWLYELVWQPKPLKLARTRGEDVGHWLILADKGGVGEALADALTDRGREVLLAYAAEERSVSGFGKLTFNPSKREDCDWLLETTRERLGTLHGVVHLMGLDAVVTDETDSASLKAAQDIACNSLPPLVQALVAASLQTPPSLWIVTQGAQLATDSPTPIAVAQTPMWGMGRVLALEHPEIWGGMVDLDPLAADTNVERLTDELLGSDGEDHIAFRGKERRVARLRRGNVDDVPSASVALRPEATYLITGGLGGLGLQVAHRLVAAGARHLVLTGRKGLPDRSTWSMLPPNDAARAAIAAVQEMERLGATVTYEAVDVSDATRMAAILEELKPRLRGVIHTAGVLEHKPILQTTYEDALTTLAPKVEGSWILHQHTRDAGLDFFVMFSSASAMWGAAMQGTYAAANHFMDGLAHHRRALGMPATSVNWGSWEGGGMVAGASDEVLRVFEKIGFGIMPADHAIEIFERFLGSDAPAQRAVASVDWSRYKPVFESRRKVPLFELIEDGTAAREGDAAGASSALLQQIASTAREDWLEILREHVRRRVMEVLELPLDAQGPPPDQGFFQLGLDSLMSVQLKRRLDADFGRALPSTLVFEHASIEALGRYFVDLLATEHTGVVSDDRSPPSRRPSGRSPEAPPSRRSMPHEAPPSRRSIPPEAPPSHRSMSQEAPPSRRSVPPPAPPSHRSMSQEAPPSRRSVPPPAPPSRRSVPPEAPPSRRSVPPEAPPSRRGSMRPPPPPPLPSAMAEAAENASEDDLLNLLAEELAVLSVRGGRK